MESVVYFKPVATKDKALVKTKHSLCPCWQGV